MRQPTPFHRLVACPGLALVALALLAAAAAADRELGHEGFVGRHALADIQDSPGGVCTFILPGPHSLGETLLRVNPPVLYAYDATAGEDGQRVGWRARIAAASEGGEWRPVHEGPWRWDEATDRQATYFGGEAFFATFRHAAGHYAVTVEMAWADPTDADRIVGRAEHAVERYAIQVASRGATTQGGVGMECRLPG